MNRINITALALMAILPSVLGMVAPAIPRSKKYGYVDIDTPPDMEIEQTLSQPTWGGIRDMPEHWSLQFQKNKKEQTFLFTVMHHDENGMTPTASASCDLSVTKLVTGSAVPTFQMLTASPWISPATSGVATAACTQMP